MQIGDDQLDGSPADFPAATSSRAPGAPARSPEQQQPQHPQQQPQQGSPSGKRRVYRCRHCEFATECKRANWRHIRVHMRPERLLACDSCEFVTEYKHHLEYHQRNHSGYKPFRCEHCDYQCVNKSMLNSHSKSHSSLYAYKCGQCKYATKYVHSLKMHLRKYNHQPDEANSLDVYGRRRGPRAALGAPNNQQQQPQQQQPPTQQPAARDSPLGSPEEPIDVEMDEGGGCLLLESGCSTPHCLSDSNSSDRSSRTHNLSASADASFAQTINTIHCSNANTATTNTNSLNLANLGAQGCPSYLDGEHSSSHKQQAIIVKLISDCLAPKLQQSAHRMVANAQLVLGATPTPPAGFVEPTTSGQPTNLSQKGAKRCAAKTASLFPVSNFARNQSIGQQQLNANLRNLNLNVNVNFSHHNQDAHDSNGNSNQSDVLDLRVASKFA